MTREGARGQEFNSAWGGGNGPDHIPTLVFTRLLAGPMDFTPGIFDLAAEGEGANNVPTTLAGQLALYVVLYSPLQMAADLPENYEPHLDAFQFIKDVPVDWADTRVLEAEIGDFVTIARKDRHSDDWYLGAKTDASARTVDLALDFLDAGADVHRRGLPRRGRRGLADEPRGVRDRDAGGEGRRAAPRRARARRRSRRPLPPRRVGAPGSRAARGEKSRKNGDADAPTPWVGGGGSRISSANAYG